MVRYWSAADGVVAAVVRNTSYNYHKAVKDIFRNDLNVRKAKLAEMANESDVRALWDELKRLNRGVKCTTYTLDGHSTHAHIVEHLATKYRALFSSQTTTVAKLNDIRLVIQDKVTCEGNAFVVTVTEVCEMTSELKINKSDGAVPPRSAILIGCMVIRNHPKSSPQLAHQATKEKMKRDQL